MMWLTHISTAMTCSGNQWETSHRTFQKYQPSYRGKLFFLYFNFHHSTAKDSAVWVRGAGISQWEQMGYYDQMWRMNVDAEKRKDLTVTWSWRILKGDTLVAQHLSCLFIVLLEVHESGRYLLHGSYIYFVFYKKIVLLCFVWTYQHSLLRIALQPKERVGDMWVSWAGSTNILVTKVRGLDWEMKKRYHTCEIRTARLRSIWLAPLTIDSLLYFCTTSFEHKSSLSSDY